MPETQGKAVLYRFRPVRMQPLLRFTQRKRNTLSDKLQISRSTQTLPGRQDYQEETKAATWQRVARGRHPER
jgi:hypothetical protein